MKAPECQQATVTSKGIDVQLGLIEIDKWRAWYADLFCCLSADEQRRASQYRNRVDCERYVVCRAILRKFLATRLKASESEIEFEYGSSAKPCLRGTSSLRFNVSHSGAYGLVAIANAVEVGCDIEESRSDLPYPSLMDSVFSIAEKAWIEGLDPHQRRHGFYRCWTRKEAVLKALGWGITEDPTEIDVLGESWGSQVRCAIFDVPLVPGYAAALAVVNAANEVPLTIERSDPDPSFATLSCFAA
jgi:4'-phosphopantetheinyl transferase